MHKFLCFGLFLIGSLLMSAITLNGNLLSNALAIENNSYNNYDNSQRYEKDNSDKYRIDPSQQSIIMMIIMDTMIRINHLKYFQLTKYQNSEINGGNGYHH